MPMMVIGTHILFIVDMALDIISQQNLVLNPDFRWTQIILKSNKKESLYEAHFRAGLLMTITATIPESGLIPNYKFFSLFSCIWLNFTFIERIIVLLLMIV